MNSVTFPIVHPPSEKLIRSSNLLHFMAGLLILAHAISHIHQPELSPVFFWCQLIIALDIFILAFAGGSLLQQMPKVNLFFRVVEILFFLGIGVIMIIAEKPFTGIFHVAIGIAYFYLSYCERNMATERTVSIHHTGMGIPGIPENKFLPWSSIQDVEVQYDSMQIRTQANKNIRFHFRKNLDFEELEQIHEFCKYYLGNIAG